MDKDYTECVIDASKIVVTPALAIENITFIDGYLVLSNLGEYEYTIQLTKGAIKDYALNESLVSGEIKLDKIE